MNKAVPFAIVKTTKQWDKLEENGLLRYVSIEF
jgi:hypothetical protein